MFAELLKSAAGVQFRIIPHRGTPEVIIATLRNDVNIMSDNYAAMRSNLQDGKPDEIMDRLKSDIVKWGKVIEQAGIPKQ